MRALVLDTQPLCFRAWHVEQAERKRNGLDGEPTLPTAMARLYQMTSSLVTQMAPTHGAAVFEGGGDTWRHEKMPGYKAGRPPKPEGLTALIRESRAMFSLVGFTCLSVAGQEADDVIASLVHQNDGVTVVSSDKDFYQFLGVSQCKLWDPLKLPHGDPPDAMRGRYIDKRDLYEKFGVTDPRQVIEVQALSGDATDAIPGCRGIGPKTAILLVQAFGSVDRLYAALDAEGPACLAPHRLTRYAANLKGGLWDVMLSRELVTLRTDLPVRLGAFCPAHPEELALFAGQMGWTVSVREDVKGEWL